MMPANLLFLTGFCFLLAHEMDAVRAKEWRLLPVLKQMDDQSGYITFTVLHVPIYVVLLWVLFNDGDVHRGLRIGLDIFFVVHLMLHVLLRNLPENRFGSMFSWVLIVGAGLFGAFDLLVTL